MRPPVLAPALVLLSAVAASAHDPGLSTGRIEVGSESLAVHLVFARADVEPLAAATGVEAIARRAIGAALDGRPLDGRVVGAGADASGNLHFRLAFSLPRGARLRIESRLIPELARGHRQWLTVAAAGGRRLAERLLYAGSASLEVDLDPPAREAPGPAGRPSMAGFLVLGVEHILTGYDHLAFLLALLLAGGTFLGAAKVISSFTVAHSVTLALSALDLVRISPAVVEPLIAVSVLYVAIENLARRKPAGRPLLTFGFGLVHGFGFAFVLRELDPGSDGAAAAAPLFLFNLGVELGQLAAAGLLFPLLAWLRRRPRLSARLVPAASASVAILGAWWLLARTVLA